MVIALLGCYMELDISIPSFPSLMDAFGASEAEVQSTMSMNFLAFCLSGLLYGPLSEAWGRRKLMLFGASCFLIGAIGCVFAHSINSLIFWRFIQGIGASSAAVLGFTMILDYFSVETAAKEIAKLNAWATIFMASAPIIGSAIAYFFPWQGNFGMIALIALISWILLMKDLPETLHTRQPLNLNQIFKDYGTLLTNKQFLIYGSMPNMLVTAYLTFVGSSAFYYMNTCELPVLLFALHQGLIVAAFSFTSFYADAIVKKLSAQTSVLLGMISCSISAMGLIFAAFLFPNTPTLVTFFMCLFAVGCAFPMSVTFSESMNIVPNLKGTSSSLIMSSRLLLSSIGIYLTGIFFDGSMRPVALVNGAAVLISVILFMIMSKKVMPENVTSS